MLAEGMPELLGKLKAGKFTLKHMSKDTQPASLIITVRERQRESGLVIQKQTLQTEIAGTLYKSYQMAV